MIRRKIKVQLDIEDTFNNIYLVLSYVRKAYRDKCRMDIYYELWDKVCKVNNYDDAMEIIKKYVIFVDENNKRIRRI